MTSGAINSVLYNIDQRPDVTAAEQKTARDNIGAQGVLTAGNNVTITNDRIDVTIPPAAQADWTATSGPSQILHKIEIAKKDYGALANTELSSLVLDLDDPDGYVDVRANNVGIGKLVSGPYATLLNSGVQGVGDSTHGIYIDSNGQFAQGNAVGTNVETTSSPYSTSTSLSRMTIYDPGVDHGSLIKDANSNNIGFLLPKHYGQNDLGKVPTVVSDDGYKIEWRDQVGGYPQIEYMGHSTYNVDVGQANYLYMEDGVCYDVMANSGGSYTIHLMTNSTTTIHSKIYLWLELPNCLTANIVYEDEGGEVMTLIFENDYYNRIVYALDVYARKVHVSGGISFDTTLCRVYDYPCANRDDNLNTDIGRVVEYIEPL